MYNDTDFSRFYPSHRHHALTVFAYADFSRELVGGELYIDDQNRNPRSGNSDPTLRELDYCQLGSMFLDLSFRIDFNAIINTA
tara:strand:- start:839 stop:1087 length:249 start_codon:yes stop_codon:yes gene_type:complete